ncbi:hypothetical protein CAEBREN_20295 [Caenorhabditis brenneri]|uniref:Uncharacterized protein n=1 Tax=Caenorhabditis brenneri TaxID=135651 RepID=G0MCP1_CAEBE|nr:hypothetical protein CAEBREN_20295 [Caenorhabditis brenneri]
MESMGEIVQQAASEKEETPAPTSSQCIISVIDLPYQKPMLTPMEAEIRYVSKADDFQGREQQKAEKFQKNDKKNPAQTVQEHILSTSIPSVSQNTEENLDVIEILYPPNTQQQKPQPPNLSQLQRLLIAVSSKNISIRPQDFDALELLVNHNEMLIQKRFEQSPTRSLGRQKKKVEHHVNLHKQKIGKVKDLLSKIQGFSEKMTVDLYYAFHELHVESKMYNPNDIEMFYTWIKNNIDLYFELDRLNERFLSGKEKESALRMERHQTISYYREKLGISGDQVGIIQNKLCLEAKNAMYGQVPLKQREYLVEEGLQNAKNNQGSAETLHIDPLTHLQPEHPSFQNYINANSISSIPLTHLNVALPPEIQLALGLNTFQIPTPPSTSSTLSPVVANGIPYTGSRASSPPSAFSAFTPIGSAAANILSPISTTASQLLSVDEPQVVKPIIPESLNQFDLLTEGEKLNKQHQVLTQRLNDLSLEDGVIHRMNKELSKDRLELKDLYNTEIELRKQLDAVRTKKRQVDFRLTENEKLKEEKVRKVKRAKEEFEKEARIYNKNVVAFNELVKLHQSYLAQLALPT